MRSANWRRATAVLFCAGLLAGELTAAAGAASPPAPVPAAAGMPVTVRAPGGAHGSGPVARIALDEGTPTLALTREGRSVLRPSPLGLTTTTADCAHGLTGTVRTAGPRTVRDTYTTVTGKRRHHRYTATEQKFTFHGARCAGLTVTVRVSHDAVAYRYTLPRAAAITAENSAFRVRGEAKAWLQEYSVDYEKERRSSTVADAREGYEALPALFRSGKGKDYLLLTEAGVDGGYAASHLQHVGGGDYRLRLPQAQLTARSTPWRVAAVGDAADVVGSDAVTDLAAPSKVRDTSWIDPGAVAWSWWADPDSPESYATQKRWVDYAAAHHLPYSLVDWHWKPEWMPQLVSYARERGVKILVWAHHEDLATKEQRAKLLPRWKKWGIAGVKIDFIDSDRQPAMRWYDRVLRQTADLRLMVSFHGTTVPRGLQRTWPHLMTSEAVRGEEYYKVAGNTGITPEHNVMLAYTRNVVGSMDYTPTVFSQGDLPHATTAAHELALAVAYESGWQCFGDDLAAYDAHPRAQRLISALPTAWDGTRLLGGDPDTYAAVARRHGDEWYVGVISAGGTRTVTLPTAPLGNGDWTAQLYEDAEDAEDAESDGGGRADGGEVSRRTRHLKGGDTLRLPLRADGGAVVRLSPAGGEDRAE
ncbi:glycoside hydrolase family 97 catalytic domain-containing protein [Streptomyces sp. PU-14G]|uniref:glycoside hydrolase family 97 protein n=1 Tax=Streptomyces sp. PU-14G TaxID=2800808 RepID=UPI0034DF76F0